MSKKSKPPKIKRFEDLKKNSKARCTNLMYVIYKEQIKEGYSDEEAHARVTKLLNSRGILLFPEHLRRGVLSEDGIYNLLERNKEVMDKLKMFFEEEE